MWRHKWYVWPELHTCTVYTYRVMAWPELSTRDKLSSTTRSINEDYHQISVSVGAGFVDDINIGQVTFGIRYVYWWRVWLVPSIFSLYIYTQYSIIPEEMQDLVFTICTGTRTLRMRQPYSGTKPWSTLSISTQTHVSALAPTHLCHTPLFGGQVYAYIRWVRQMCSYS